MLRCRIQSVIGCMQFQPATAGRNTSRTTGSLKGLFHPNYDQNIFYTPQDGFQKHEAGSGSMC